MVRLSDQGFAKPYGDEPSGVRRLDGCLSFDDWQMGEGRASADPWPPDSPDGNRPDAPDGVHVQTIAAIGVKQRSFHVGDLPVHIVITCHTRIMRRGFAPTSRAPV